MVSLIVLIMQHNENTLIIKILRLKVPCIFILFAPIFYINDNVLALLLQK
jgi:hypothetical protein